MDVDYLVTGGAGFIGCALAEELLSSDEAAGSEKPRILVADSLHPQVHPQRQRPEALPSSVNLSVMDICDPDAWDRLLSEFRPRAVVHLAAETGTGQSLDLPTRHTNVNVNGTAQMLEAFDRAKFMPKHFVLGSSRAIYGEGQWRDPIDGSRFLPGHRTHQQLAAGQFKVFAPSGNPAEPLVHDHAETPAVPTSVYGVTKFAQEQLLALWCDARHVPLTVLRLQNVYGAGQSPYNPYTGIIGLFHRVAAGGDAIEVYEDGLIGRDFVYIDDVVRSFAAALRVQPAAHRTLDVGTGIATTILDAARTIASMYDGPVPKISGAFRDGDIRWAVARTEQLHAELGVVPTISFGEGNSRLSQWLRETGVIR